MVNKYGPKKWSAIAQALPGRIGKQCRERYAAASFLFTSSFIEEKVIFLLCNRSLYFVFTKEMANVSSSVLL